LERQALQHAMWAIWPGFLTAIGAEVVFFAMFDPLDFNMRLHLSREAIYTFGFVAFWLLGTLSSAITLFLQRPPEKRADDAVAAVSVGDEWR